MPTLRSRLSRDPAQAASYFARQLETEAMGPGGAGQAIVDGVLDRAVVAAKELAEERLNPRAGPFVSNSGTRRYRNAFHNRAALPDGRGKVVGFLSNSHPAARIVEHGSRPHEILGNPLLSFFVPDGWVGRYGPGYVPIPIHAPKRTPIPGGDILPFAGRRSTTTYQSFGEAVFPRVKHPGTQPYHIMRDAMSKAIQESKRL